MTRRRDICGLAAAALLLLTGSAGSLRAEPTTENWLRGSGDDLQLRLTGEVVDSDGRPAAGVRVTGGMNAVDGTHPVEPTVEGNRFEVWLPVNQVRAYSLWLKAAPADESCVAYQQLSAEDLRQSVINGLRLELELPTRQVDVIVVHDDRPVPGAIVKAELGYGIELRSRADGEGIARFALLPNQEWSSFTVWTDDYRIGGFQFSRKPVRDPKLDEHVVELSKCRDETLRFVDENGAPVPGVDFRIQMATPPPNYNYLGTNEHSSMTTDAAGEVLYRWFPDWDDHHYYVEINNDHWVTDGEKEIAGDGAIEFQLKKSRFAERKRVTGRVVSTETGLGGFYVSLRSFEGERERHSDVLRAYTDSDGTFAVDVLPDATYCAYAIDTRWVSEIIDWIPYESVTDRVTPPELSISAGQPVVVNVTTGPQKRAYPSLGIYVRRVHEYTWQEDGKTRHGSGGPGWWVKTDVWGRATTRTLPGKLEVSVFTPLWRTNETVDVKQGEPVRIDFHRELEGKRTVTGRLMFPIGVAVSLEDAEVHCGAVDGNYDDQQTVTAGPGGRFTVETIATELGVFASTQDGRMAGSIVTSDLETPLEVPLRPTMDYEGRLLGDNDQPLAGHRVYAIIRVEGDEDFQGNFVKSFDAERITAETDALGHYRLRGVPTRMKVLVAAAPIEGSSRDVSLDKILLEPGESRPPAVSRLNTAAKRAVTEPLAERFQTTLRDAALSAFHVMVITSDGNEQAKRFIDRNLLDYDKDKTVTTFMQLVVPNDPEGIASADAAFLSERDWPVPSDGRVFACALDGGGNELGRIEIDVSAEGAARQASDFIHQHAPPQADAEEKWNEAFAEAKRSNRRVWARISQRYCGPCFRFARWLDDQKALLERDYVMLKIDDFRDQNGRAIAERLTLGQSHGVPFHAIFDPNEVMLIDSQGPLGNIGHPSDFEGRKQLHKMLYETRQQLTDPEIEQLVESLNE